ncbi:MAG: T9SS type A sorting domain-containing protein, partial [Bacteroidales bacterium]|nr:T9SS type A sorting domain-containing protein [Bacteroidales bacterium]
VQQTTNHNYIIGGFSTGNGAADFYLLKVVGEDITALNDVKQTDKSLISQNYPNPFHQETTISFTINKADFVSIDIYNIQGKKIKTLLNAYLEAEKHHITWNGQNEAGKTISEGVFFYKIQTGDIQITKMIIKN